MSHAHRHHARCACALRALAGKPFVLPGTTRKYERSRPFTIAHIALDLTLDMAKKSVAGTASLRVERVDPEATELRLDAVALAISAVEIVNGEGRQRASFVHDGDALVVTIDEAVKQATVVVTYRATPRRGLYFLAPDDHVRDRPAQVWSQCQDEDARYWFPCHDKPHARQTTEMTVRVPKGWYALSNGTLQAHTTEAEHEVYHWLQGKAHPSYLVTLVAGEFTVLDGGTAGGVPLTYLVPPGREQDGQRTFAETPAMVDYFGKVTGVTFPWEKYAQVVVSDFIFGGMENTSATTMYEHILLDPRAALDISSDDLIAHELAHQWFGDLVTCRDWSHGWLNEGFATYFEHIDRERRLGNDEYELGVKGDLDAYLTEAATRYQRPIVCQDYEAPIDLFDRHLYEKGGLVLHMLRRTLGDELFWKGIHLYLSRHAHGIVETRDLLRSLEDASGRSLERFFDQWVFKAGHPSVEVKIEHAGGMLLIEVKQTQKTGPDVPVFAFDLEIDIYPEQGEPRREVLPVEGATESFVIAQDARPRFLVVDPRFLVVGDLSAEVPTDMLRRQLREAPTARGRSAAAAALGRRDDPSTTEALAASLRREEEFWGVRAEVAAALGALRSPAALAALTATVTTTHPKVRRAVASALGKFRSADAAAQLQKLALRDASYLVEAEAARALGATRQSIAFDTLVEVLDRPSWADVIRSGAIDGLSALRDDRAVPHLAARTRYGVPTRARRAAIRALPRVAPDRRSRELLEDLLDDSDPYLRVDVAVAIGDVGDPKARPALARALDRELDGRVRRRLREVMRDLGSSASARAEQQRMQEEVDRLRSDLSEMRSRLAKLEAPAAQTVSTTRGALARPASPPPAPASGASRATSSGTSGQPAATASKPRAASKAKPATRTAKEKPAAKATRKPAARKAKR